MKRVVHQTVEARRDLVEIVAYLAERSQAAGRRFRAAAEATFERLAKTPGIGTRYETDNPAHEDLRYCIVSKFRNYVVFYRPTDDGIEVVRVLHGARDLGALLKVTGEDES
jgi:toxin ParE1/3/4